MPPFVWFLAGGNAFFLGTALVLSAALLSALKQHSLTSVIVYLRKATTDPRPQSSNS